MNKPHFVALGGTTRDGSSTERALVAALAMAEERGAKTTLLGSAALALPHYAPEKPERSPEAEALVATLRSADAVIIGSPGYHGALSGLVKNALDYVEDMSKDDRCYFDNMPIGCISTAAGWQAAVATLTQLRAIAHALRGWPTPIGVPINSIPAEGQGDPIQADGVQNQLRLMIGQQFDFLNR